jgi:hypothetical protein
LTKARAWPRALLPPESAPYSIGITRSHHPSKEFTLAEISFRAAFSAEGQGDISYTFKCGNARSLKNRVTLRM